MSYFCYSYSYRTEYLPCDVYRLHQSWKGGIDMYVVYPHNEGTTFCCMRCLLYLCAVIYVFSYVDPVKTMLTTTPGLDILITLD